MMTRFFFSSFFLTFILCCQSSGVYNIDDTQLFKIDYQGFDTQLLPEPASAELETLRLRSANNEEYSCTIPKIEPKNQEGEEPYVGNNALEILQQLFLTQSCAYRLEHYWTYELCHGRYIRQFHEEREGKSVKTTEYFLGKYDSDKFDNDLAGLKKDIEEGNNIKPKKMKIDSMNMPYYQLLMGGGTICDLNGEPRVTRVNYVCYPSGKHEMYSFKESSTCEYDVIILSPSLCNHPDFRPEESTENVITCKPTNENSPAKPKSLQELEEESLKLRSEKMYQGNFMQGNKPGSVRIEIKPVNADGSEDDLTDEGLEEDAENYRDENWPTRKETREFKPLMDPEVVKDFLMGKYCLYGGAGWWKYEFCYGKKVDQYHEDAKTGQKTVINLGRFDDIKHLKWLTNNPTKRPKPVASRKHVSHFYSDGDICDLTGKPRHVEVKLKCKKLDSPSAVSLYLLEPKTCEYVLGVESPLVCDIMHLADENGVMEIEEKVFEKPDSSTIKTTKTTITRITKEDGKTIKTLKETVETATKTDEDGNFVKNVKEAVKLKDHQEQERLRAERVKELEEKNQQEAVEAAAKAHHELHLRQHEEQMRFAQAQHEEHVNQHREQEQNHPDLGEPIIVKRWVEPKFVHPKDMDEMMYDMDDDEDENEEDTKKGEEKK